VNVVTEAQYDVSELSLDNMAIKKVIYLVQSSHPIQQSQVYDQAMFFVRLLANKVNSVYTERVGIETPA